MMKTLCFGSARDAAHALPVGGETFSGLDVVMVATSKRDRVLALLGQKLIAL